MAHRTPPLHPAVEKCSSDHRETHTVVADLDGALIHTRSSFPYFALIAFDSGGVLRLLFLLLLTPLAAVLRRFISESAGIRVLIFASLAGVKLSSIESTARAVLPKFYVEDLREDTWRVFSGCGRRYVVTGSPRVMVEVFLKEYLGADEVVGTELGSYMGRATGFVGGPGVLVGEKKALAVKKLMVHEVPEIGVGGWKSGLEFLRHCKEAYVAQPKTGAIAQRSNSLPKPVVFHDGRLVQRPTPVIAFTLILWFPFSIILAGLRIAAGALLPMKYAYFAFWVLGVRVIVNGAPPPPTADESGGHSGMLFVCSHRTLLDPIFLSAALRRPVSAVTYSLSRLSEFLSPIKTVRLTRHRINDAAIINSLLKKGDLVLCPEGTTSREPLLLRFSALFAELSDEMVPVGMASRISMFHGTTTRGWKGLDSLYFFMNPTPIYEVTFLNKLPAEHTCGAGGKSSHEVANYIQGAIAAKLGYECTGFTRKDKYMALAGNHGSMH